MWDKITDVKFTGLSAIDFHLCIQLGMFHFMNHVEQRGAIFINISLNLQPPSEESKTSKESHVALRSSVIHDLNKKKSQYWI